MKQTILILTTIFCISNGYAQTTTQTITNDKNGRMTRMVRDTITRGIKYDKVGNWIADTTTFTIPNIPLPMELLTFEATGYISESDKSRYSKLEWSINQTESDNSFEVQWSSEENINWQAVGTIQANAKTGKQDYETFHFTPEPINGVNYYRLKLYDIQGQYKFSEIRKVVFNQKQNLDIKIYPNPTDGIAVVEVITSAQNVSQSVNVYAQSGKRLSPSIQKVSTYKWHINTNSLSKGTYNIVVTDQAQDQKVSKTLVVR